MKVVLENRRKDTWHLPVYEDDNRHIKFTVILGRSDDRDRMIQQQEGPAQRLPTGRAFYEHKAIAEHGAVHSPMVELTAQEWELLLKSHNGPMIQQKLAEGELMMNEVRERRTRRKTAEQPAA